MTFPRQGRARARAAETSAGRFLLVLAVLTAFLFQSFATQTHIHISGEAVAQFLLPVASQSIPLKTELGQKAPHKKAPADDPANCPLCQAMFLSGQFVSPSAVVFVLPSQPLALILLALALPAIGETASHIWQGRAPPRL